MRLKEIFNETRKTKQRFSLKFRFTLFVSAEIVFSILLALGIECLLVSILEDYWKMPLIVELLTVALTISLFVSYALAVWFINPIKKLGNAMEEVANGNFDVRLEVKKSTAKEIKEIYSGFNMMAKELSTTEILQNDFVSNVSHEFKTPINAIEGYSTLLQGDDNLTDEQKEYVDKIIFNTKRLSTLTGSILLLSKLEHQSLQTTKVSFDLDEQVRQSILALEGEWERKNIDLIVEMDDTEYFGNESLTHHIWSNIISNAIKFSPYGAEVIISLFNRPDEIIFSVSDRGPGISEDAMKHIFNKFYQADTSHKEHGNGLGLALVKKIVELEGGTISVENNEDAGCTFTVTLKKQDSDLFAILFFIYHVGPRSHGKG